MKKLFVLAAAVAALAAMALPTFASATASNWKDKGVEITGNATIPVTGNASFSGGTNCKEVTGSFTIEPGSTGKVTAFTPVVASCEVTGTLKALGCTSLAAATTENLNYTIHDTTTKAIITGVKITNHYNGGAFCPKTTTIEGDVDATPDSTTAITQLTLSGEINSSLGTKVTVGGVLKPVNASDSGTYGL